MFLTYAGILPPKMINTMLNPAPIIYFDLFLEVTVNPRCIGQLVGSKYKDSPVDRTDDVNEEQSDLM